MSNKIKIGGIMQCANLVEMRVMSIPDQPGTAGKILKGLGENGINVQFIVQCIDIENNDHVALCIGQCDVEAASEILEEVRQETSAKEVVQRPNVALISVFGPDFRERPGIAGAMFSALGERGINILAISTSISTLSCVIDGDDLESAVAAMQETFELP